MDDRFHRPLPRRATATRLAAALSLALVSAGASAQALPRQFDFSVTYTFVTSSRNAVETGQNDAATALHASFAVINDAGGAFMHHMFGPCSYVFVQASGKLQLLGGCNYEDKDGDKLYESIRMAPGGPGELSVTGGTGKFAGLQCEGRFQTVTRSRDGLKGIGRKTGGCRMP